MIKANLKFLSETVGGSIFISRIDLFLCCSEHLRLWNQKMQLVWHDVPSKLVIFALFHCWSTGSMWAMPDFWWLHQPAAQVGTPEAEQIEPSLPGGQLRGLPGHLCPIARHPGKGRCGVTTSSEWWMATCSARGFIPRMVHFCWFQDYEIDIIDFQTPT